MTTIHADTVVALSAPQPPGTVIMLKRGVVYQGPIVFRSSGSATAPIRITAYGTGAAPLIKGTPALFTDALTVTGSYVDIDSLGFSDTNRAAVEIAATALHVSLSGSDMARVGQGVGILGSFVAVTHCTIHDLTMVKNTPIDRTSPATIAATNNDDYGANGVLVVGSHVELAHNTITNAKAQSFDYGTDGGAFELFTRGHITDISIHDNWVQDSEGFLEGGGAFGSGAAIFGLHVFRNVSLNSGEFASLHNAGGAFGAAWSGSAFFNNTIVEERPDPKLVLIRADGPVQADLKFHHNIVWMNGGDSIWKQSGPDYHADNVFWFGTPKTTHIFNNWGMELSPGEHIMDPMFVDRERRNFSLRPDSLALGVGAK